MSPELQCDKDQFVCPAVVQNITCQCVVMGTNILLRTLFWFVDTDLIGYFDHLGSSVYINPNYTATVELLENGLSSNLCFPAELQSGILTVECEDADLLGNSNTKSFSIEGLLLEVYFCPI